MLREYVVKINVILLYNRNMQSRETEKKKKRETEKEWKRVKINEYNL